MTPTIAGHQDTRAGSMTIAFIPRREGPRRIGPRWNRRAEVVRLADGEQDRAKISAYAVGEVATYFRLMDPAKIDDAEIIAFLMHEVRAAFEANPHVFDAAEVETLLLTGRRAAEREITRQRDRLAI